MNVLKKIVTAFILLTAVFTATLSACSQPDTPETVLPTLAPVLEQPTVEPTLTPTAVPQLDESLIDWPPQIIFTSPAIGEPALLDGAITVRFDQPMNQASVESAFEISLLSGDKVNGQFSWPRPDTLLFTPETSLEPKQQFTVHIDETAVSANGLTLPETIRFDLETVGFLQVGQVVPAQDTIDVLPDSPITIFFNKPVVPLTTTDQQDNLPEPLRISPSVEGKGQWISTSIYQYKPRTVLDGATTYTVTVDPNLADVTNGRLETPFTWQFSTISPSVLNLIPQNGETLIRPEAPLHIEFNMPMDVASTENAIRLQGGAADVSFEWLEDGRSVTLTPDTPLELGLTYDLIVESTALSANGNAGLVETAVSQFQTVPFPAILRTFPANGQQTDRFQQGVRIQFASPMDIATLEDQIVISPEPEGGIEYFFNNFSNELSIQFEYVPSERYSVTIPRGAADPYGNTIGQPYGFVFTTPPRTPVLSFNYPQFITQLSSSFDSRAELIHLNVSDATVELYDIGLPLGLLTRFYEVAEYRPAATPIRRWELAFEAEENVAELIGLRLADNGALPPGVYLLTAQSPDLLDENATYWQNQRQLIVVSDSNLVVKQMFDAVHVWATDLRSGQPAPNLTLSLYDEQGIFVGTAVSDNNGFATFPFSTPNTYLDSVTVVANQPGQLGFGVASSGWEGSNSPWQMGIPYTTNQDQTQFVYMYTDRPIYRPGDTVYFKGIARDNRYGRYSLPTFNILPVNLNFNGYSETEPYSERIDVALNEDGTFNGEVTLPDSVAVGGYSLSLNQDGLYAEHRFTIAEYRRPELALTFTNETTEALRGESTTLELSADYFFGGAAVDLPVQWSATAVSDNVDFSFGIDPFGGIDIFLASGEGVTDENGRFQFELTPELLDELEAGTVTVLVDATVTDLSNLTISTRTDFTFHAAETYVSVEPRPFVLTIGQSAELAVQTTDWDGLPVSNQTVELVVFSREWESTQTTDFSGYITLWESVDTEVGRQTVTTDEFGEATASFMPESGGSFVVKATVTDRTGRSHTSETVLWVGGVNGTSWRLDPRNKLLNIRVDQDSYRIGDTAELLVQSPFEEPVQAWLTIERGELISQQLITLNGTSDVLTIPITDAYAPNVFVSLTAVKPFNPDDANNPQADIRLGIAELVVDPEQFVLDVTLTPQDDSLAPRDTAVFDIQVTNFLGNPVAAELSLALVDKAILTLKSDEALPIDEAFYQRQPLRSRTGTGLFISGENLTPELPLEVLGRGGGGAFAEAAGADGVLARAGEFEDEARSDFPDTAFWQAVVTTDAMGRASISIELPDTLTTWVLRSKVVNENSQVGEAEVEIVTALPLIVRPITPRFLTVGDSLQLGAIVNNNTGTALETAVSLQASGVQLNSDATQTIIVPVNGQAAVHWQISVPDGATVADFTFRAEAGELVDVTKPSFGVGPNNQIPIYRYTARDIVGTANVLSEAGRQVEAIWFPDDVDPSQGQLTIQTDSSLTGSLFAVVNELAQRPLRHSCPSAIADALLPRVVAVQASQLQNIEPPAATDEIDSLITQLLTAQNGDGGWGWCSDTQSSPLFTAQIVVTLWEAQEAGYRISSSHLISAVTYLASQNQTAQELSDPHAINQQIFSSYAQSLVQPIDLDSVLNFYDRHFEQLLPESKAFLALMLNSTGLAPSIEQALVEGLNGTAVISASGAHWEADVGWASWQSDVRNTAVVLFVLSQIDPESELLVPAVRWLMTARQATHWGTDHDTAWATLSLIKWAQQSGDAAPNFEYSVLVDLAPEIEGIASAETAVQTTRLNIPIGDLGVGEPHFVEFNRQVGDGNLYYTVFLDTALDASRVTAVDRGVQIIRTYYVADCDPKATVCEPIEQIEAGEQVRVELTITVANDMLYAIINDPIPAGTEAINPNLDISNNKLGSNTQPNQYQRGYWGYWLFNQILFQDEQVSFIAPFLPAGTYQYTYFLQAAIPGEYQVMPTFARQAFMGDVNGRSAGMLFVIEE